MNSVANYFCFSLAFPQNGGQKLSLDCWRKRCWSTDWKGPAASGPEEAGGRRLLWPAAPRRGGGLCSTLPPFSRLLPPHPGCWVLAHHAQMLRLRRTALLAQPRCTPGSGTELLNCPDSRGNLDPRLPLDGDAWRKRSGE